MMNEKHCKILLLVSLSTSLVILGNAFTTPNLGLTSSQVAAFEVVQTVRSSRKSSSVVMMAAGGKRKRRRRKQPPGKAPIPESTNEAAAVVEPVDVTPIAPSEPINTAKPVVEEKIETLDDIGSDEEVDIAQIADIANFKFEPEQDSDGMVQEGDVDDENAGGEPIPLPDIKQVLQKKAMEQLAKAEEEENEEKRVKIDRRDKKALVKLLEQQPYADADDSFFEEEEYGTVSALLGERAKPFLGIPTGPLQVGHFIGALVIVLMAFVEYPGFPLTNLPSALRGALQGGT